MPNCGQRIIEKQQYGQAKPGLNLTQIGNFEILDPDINFQHHFAAIVEKVEGIKSRYQESLADLETLYGALSQKAFKGELDLSRVPLSSESTEVMEEENHDTSEQQQTTNTSNLPAPSDLAALKSAEGRNAILDQWLAIWHEQLNNEPIPVQLFMEAAQQRLWEIADDGAQQRLWELTEDDTLELGAAEYDYVRAWIFESLGRGRLAQTYDDDKNRVQLKAVSNR
ncbi:hypothetical protein K9N68_39700 (plasmid) [Kovacikia minuta CCNUW1]|uniref:restriction endonuclease subunit S n=1 Tax=Kovacikia minuta TaxID=2931930 RepID=UPI001CCBEB94|nr:hypothetical protein [Kovacikia minuta]UBF30780.1 hypothetical protein K9N68_39700 [Kovacikia minuta CCNUW1]